MSDPLQIKRLLRRPQFLAAAKGVSQARGAVVVQQLDRQDGQPAIRLGFTATRKVGGAVVRNRCKRRLREAALATPSCFPDTGEVITLDGVRAEFAHGFGLARASNTTPVVVLRFEADDAAALDAIQTTFRRAIDAVWPGLQLPF